MISRGKPPGAPVHGDQHGQAKLTEKQVYLIRRKRSAGYSAKSLADEFAVSRSTVYAIAARTLWAHLPEEVEVAA
ncbi:helix-turn-helix domain-containing protein [Nocardia sp. NPDC059246]|uniref:helix-turn-helix domain-containing protein n=1 Tax=unclassified Nocardia TaxID=2637762 RepID=UPI0036BB308B